MKIALSVAFALVCVAARVAHADECPTSPSDKERRPLAREWFTRAEAAEKAGRDTDALRAYECSFSLYKHAFTAFNIAKAAERVGDLELAIERYGTYLALRTDASDRGDVERTVAELRARLDRVRETAATADVAPSRSDPPSAPPARDTTPEGAVSRPPPPPRAEAHGSSKGVLPWVATAGGVALLAGGVALNLAARSRIDECHSRFKTGNPGYATSCNDAKPLAYGSYAALGLGGAAAALGVLLFVLPSSPENATVSWAPTSGGGLLAVDGRF